jgi:hypothetical protein
MILYLINNVISLLNTSSVIKHKKSMLLVAAGTTQALLLCDLLLRRILFLFLPGRRGGLKRFADNLALTSFAAAVLQAATLPVLAVASAVSTLGRSLALIALAFVVFGSLLVMSTSAVYAYSVLARIYNLSVAPVVVGMQWLFSLLDFVFRAVVPLYNGLAFMTSEILRRLVLPYSFQNVEALPEMFQGVALALVTLGLSVTTWLKNVMECTVLYETAERVCGLVGNATALRPDCSGIFTAVHTQCYAAPNHLTVDLLTPGLFVRQTVMSLRRVVAGHCGVAALIVNLVLFPLADHHLYAAVHAGVNTALYGVVGLPVTTVRRCEAIKLAHAGDRAMGLRSGLSRTHELVACTPDWEPLMLMASSTLESVGEVINGWLNAGAMLVRDRIGADSDGAGRRCDEAVRMQSVVLDAARAIEGHQSIEALERLQSRGGLPDGETLTRVRVAGLTPKLFGVTDGKAVLYRGAHDGYVWAYGAWPFAVDVELGLAAVSYSGSASETDSTGDTRTGLLGCRCLSGGEFRLLCATAPYVTHVDDDPASLNSTAVHVVAFPGLSLLGMTCDTAAVRVVPLRWPRRRLATAEGNGGSGYAGYQRASFLNVAQRVKGDTDATDNLRLLAHKFTATQAGAVEAAIFVQPLCRHGSSPACWRDAPNCYPWCMGVVRGGVRAQNVTMYSAQRWEDHVVMPDVDCGVQRSHEKILSGECGEAAPAIVDIMSREGVVSGRCNAARMCVPSPVPGLVMSLVPLANRDARVNASELGLVVEHKRSTWLAVRTRSQPFAVAGDVTLGVTPDKLGQPEAVVVTRLYDIGHGSLQMGSERLTLTSNSHAVKVARCDTPSDSSCYAESMAAGKIVLPQSLTQVYENPDYLSADGGGPPGLVPAAASRWAVHWADNPDLAVYRVLFNFCRGIASFGIIVRSSFGRARVWTLQTMRGVDMEAAGEPSDEEVRSRVSYMRVPEFFGDQFAGEQEGEYVADSAQQQCETVVGLKIVGVEYLNAQNILVTVLAARPFDYDPETDTVSGPRTYRYYFLNPSRHDCHDVNDEEAVAGDQDIFSCWRSHDKGMWPGDSMLEGRSWGARPAAEAQLATGDAPCAEARLVPDFGTALVVPITGMLSLVQTILDAVCTLTACVAAVPLNPLLALRDLQTVDLERASFHSMTDSAGARLLRVDDIISAGAWMARFNAHMMIYVVNALTSVTSALASNQKVDKTLSGLRTVIVGAAKVAEGGSAGLPAFKPLEGMFEQPIAFASTHASTAVLGMADGLESNMRLPSFVSVFARSQMGMVGTLSVTLRLFRVTVLRVMESGAGNAASAAGSAFMESQSIVKADLLDTIRSQCYGMSQVVGATQVWGRALRHLCLLLPDTLEGVLTVVSVLVLDYPTVSCACKLSDRDMNNGMDASALDAVTRICLMRPLPIEETQWLNALTLNQDDRREICFTTMDRANTRLSSAFDKSYFRLRQMTEYIEGVVDGLLGVITGDSVDCDAFDISPYVVTIIPEPVDYFTACADTDDCRIKCLEQFSAFEAAKAEEVSRNIDLGFQTTIAMELESLLFSAKDIEEGKNRPPFQISDMTEISRQSCATVCGGTHSKLRNRCLALAGLREGQFATAYYCLPIDVTQYAFLWVPPNSPENFPLPSHDVLSVHLASSWGAQFGVRDAIIAVVRTPDDAFMNNTDLLDDGVTRVQLCVDGQALPYDLVRTSVRAERMEQIDVERPAARGYLHRIEHVQVDLADRLDQVVTVEAWGYAIDLVQMPNTELKSWGLPRKACVRCELRFSSPTILSETTCSTTCAPVYTVSQDSEFDFVQRHKRICVRELGAEEAERQEDMCMEHMRMPTNSQDLKAVHLQVLLNGTLFTTKIAMPDSLVSLFRVDALARSYKDVENKVHVRTSLLARVLYLERRHMASLRALAEPEARQRQATQAPLTLEILTANAQDVHGGWLHVLNLKLSANGVSGRLRAGLQASTVTNVTMGCGIQSCAACTRRGNDQIDDDLFMLQNLCYAAQQCSVERCAGTLVNMRKPLCNLGKVLAGEMHGMRVLLKGVWTVITDKIIMTVELTYSRRQEFEVKWPDTALRQQTCTAKDNIVSMAATLTSVVGAISHIMRDVSQQGLFGGGLVDARAHARDIMTLTAVTNLLTSVMLLPVYMTIVAQKVFSCTANDISYSISEFVASAQEQRQPELKIDFGGNMQQAAERAEIAVCMSEDVAQALKDTGRHIQDVSTVKGSGVERDVRKVVRLLSDALSSMIDVTLRTTVQFSTAFLDVSLTWAAGIIKGMMDVAQTVDWSRCKLPVVDNGLESLGQCACGDEPYSIPASQRERDWTTQGFWCSGLLMLNEGDGNDLLVWNPFSLQELLQMKGSREESDTSSFWSDVIDNLGGGRPGMFTRRLLQSQGDFDEYVACLQAKWPSECENLKPLDVRITQQGVEVLQVVSRCRDNYQQKRWDEASTLYALFTIEEWRSGSLKTSKSMERDDPYTLLRKKVANLVENDKRFWTSTRRALDLSPGAWACLADALAAGILKHNCHSETGTTFAYVPAANSLASSIDACKVPATIADRPFPRFLWTGSSTNHVPIAKMHDVDVSRAEREKQAGAKIANMIATEIKPTFERLTSADFQTSLDENLDIDAFSVEGDELHQLIDCVVLGPFASASMSSEVHLENLPRLPVPLYHRGSASSRRFTSWQKTGGSPSRRAFVRAVLEHVSSKAKSVLQNRVNAHIEQMALLWLDPKNFFCTCSKGGPDISCCAGVPRKDLSFSIQGAFTYTSWEISSAVIKDVFRHVADSDVIESKWLQQIGHSVPLDEEHRSIVQTAQLFASSGTVPVHTYGAQNTITVLNNESVWEWCTSRVTGLFATMPLTEEGSFGTPDVPLGQAGDPFQYDPARERDSAPTRDHFNARRHAMELLVDDLLVRARAFSPHFWTHAHRYVASDSVWCEREDVREDVRLRQPPNTTSPSLFKGRPLRPEPVLAPDADHLLFPAEVLHACACGWSETAGACFIPREVCGEGTKLVVGSGARLEDGRFLEDVWASLCNRSAEAGGQTSQDDLPRYTQKDDLVVVLQVLSGLDPAVLKNCSARQPSVSWGLLSPEQTEAWYTGASGADQPGGSWKVDAQHIATTGPAGIRLGMLSTESPQSLRDYTKEFELGERADKLFNAYYKHSIGQPVCNNTVKNLLREELDEYFVNTLLPMAHSVQIVPAVEYCVRWTIEYALVSVLRAVMKETAEGDSVARDRLQLLISRQQMTSEQWEDRCLVQAQDVSMCVLRGVYDIVPEDRQTPPQACAFSGHQVRGCNKWYYTSACLLYCDGVFYDPCMCVEQRRGCTAVLFEPSSCPAGRIADGRLLFQNIARTEEILTSSMHWPSEILPGEARDLEHELSLQDVLQKALTVAKHDADLSGLFQSASSELVTREDEENVPHSYCDDLLDYWPDAQHPVGYHPTTACSATETYTRGFAAWMSESFNGSETFLDPVRVRNATLASQVFGASNLMCDAHTYAAPGHRLNPYYMQTKWNENSVADPSIPREAPRVTLEEMSYTGEPSFEDTDTTLRIQAHSSDVLLQHSVGLVRAWARWYPLPGAPGEVNENSAEDAQTLLDSAWPHWLWDPVLQEEITGFFLSDRSKESPKGCGFPPLDVCTSDIECRSLRNNARELVCLKNAHNAGPTQTGVCMARGTCYQHHHCHGSNPAKLCSGEGECVSPTIRVRNDAIRQAEVQLFANDGCTVSMKRLSLFESIPDFATANGMCSFRNWYHYRNITDTTSGYNSMIEVADGPFYSTREPFPSTLSELKILSSLAHACDRTYAHTDYKACYADDYDAQVRTVAGDKSAESVDVSRTWVEDEGAWSVRFCNLKAGGAVTGFLSPYKQEISSLHSASQDIRRCVEYNLCPELRFHIRGKGVEKRRVVVHETDIESQYGVKRSSSLTRDYCPLDAQRCWGVGFLLGKNCDELSREESDKCIPDPLVVPLVHVVFGNTQGNSDQEAQSALASLRTHCPRAFMTNYMGLSQFELFKDVREHLTTPYRWTDAERLFKVHTYANSLLWFVFGMSAEIGSGNRGFTSVEQYLEHSRCMVHVAQALLAHEAIIRQENEALALYSSSAYDDVVPGASLYIFLKRVPVIITLRWFAQCVVFSTADEGGVSARFLALINEVEGVGNIETHCRNYEKGSEFMDLANNPAVQDESEPMVLKTWLQTAPFLFQEWDANEGDSVEDRTQMHATQISRDVINTISWSIGQLPVLDIPDIVCISDSQNDLEGRLSGTRNIRDRELLRHQNPGVDHTSPGGYLTMLTESRNISIYTKVLDFLTNKKIVWNLDTPTISVLELLTSGVLENLHDNILDPVVPSEVIPRYDYTQLNAKPMLELYRSFHNVMFSAERYLRPASETCSCPSRPSQTCRRLETPEYSLSVPTRCADVKVLPCTPAVLYLLDERAPATDQCVKDKLPCQFLLQDELLYLILLILDKEITYTASGGFMSLHKIRTRAASLAVEALFTDTLPDNVQTLSFAQATQFNDFVEERSASSFKCPSKTYDPQKITNQMHLHMRTCSSKLKVPVGWRVPARAASFSSTLILRPKVDSLLKGFYASFLLRNRNEDKTFLDKLMHTSWTSFEYQDFTRTICYEEDEEVRVIAPFWAEFFDVATNLGQEDSAGDPPIACDMQRSGADSKLMIYSTMCTSDASNPRSCAQHPEYEHHVEHTLPEICQKKHGQPVVRSRIGTLKHQNAPLCELKPDMPDTCAFKHGAFFGYTGERVADLDEQGSPVRVHAGLWQKDHDIFRGRHMVASGPVPALRLLPHDIGGHCLEFAISAAGYMYLDKAVLANDCSKRGGRVSDWLQNIEQDWSWENSLAQQIMAHDESDDVPGARSWRCPLHWLGQFHDDNGKHQARGPSWRRNQERFSHITGSLRFAHPTVRDAYRLRGLRAASFVSDGIACVAADTKDCHSTRFLDETLTQTLTDNTWHTVQYVSTTPELMCNRVLDWPSDCGSSTPSGAPGACILRD